MNQNNPEDIDFSQYIPKWKDESDDDQEDFVWHFKDGFEKAFDDVETQIDEQGDIRWKHIIKAAHILMERNDNKKGPYSKKQVDEVISEVVIQEALDALIEKNIIKKNENGTFQLTETGDAIADEIAEYFPEDPEKDN